MPGSTPRTAADGLLTIAALVVVVAGLKAATALLLPFLMAVFLTVLTAPLVLGLERRRVPAWIAVLLTMIVLTTVLALFGALLTTSVQGFDEALPGYQRALSRAMTHGKSWIERLPVDLSAGAALESIDPASIVGWTSALVGTVVAALSNTALVVLTVVFMLLEVAGFPRKLRLALDDPQADLGRWGGAMREVQRYLAIKTLVSLATGALVALWLWILGIDFPLLLGLVAFMLNYVPNIGSILAALPAVLVAAVQPGAGPGHAALVALGYLAINVTLGNVIEPQLMGRKLGLSPLVVFLSLVFWGFVWGPFGMLLSVPLTMVVRIVLEQRPETRWVAVLLGPANALDRPLTGGE